MFSIRYAVMSSLVLVYLKGRPQSDVYLHDVHSHPLCGHALHVVDQPMNDFGAYEAVEWEAFLFWEQLYTGPESPSRAHTQTAEMRTTPPLSNNQSSTHHSGCIMISVHIKVAHHGYEGHIISLIIVNGKKIQF